MFDEETFGGTLGGPLIRDRLFFFLSYEKLEREAPQDIGATGSGYPVEVPDVTQAEYGEIRRIGLDVYGYDIGENLRSAPEEDEKFLAKLDWNINDSHRASLAYQHTEGNELTVNLTNNNPGLSRLGAPSNWYDRTILMETASLQLFSDWNEYFSTELKLARKEVNTAQVSLFGTDFGEMLIRTPSGGTVYIGSDEFRHANELANDIDSIKLAGSFFVGGHTLLVGYEREMLDIFNIFVPRSQGQWTFDSIDDFERPGGREPFILQCFHQRCRGRRREVRLRREQRVPAGRMAGDTGPQDPGRHAHGPFLRQRQAAAQRELHAVATVSAISRRSTGASSSCRASASTGGGRRRRPCTAASACSAAARRTCGSRTVFPTTA